MKRAANMAVYSGIVVLSLGAPSSLISTWFSPHVLLQAYEDVRVCAVTYGLYLCIIIEFLSVGVCVCCACAWTCMYSRHVS